MNTDGLGTPLEASNPSMRPSQKANSKLKDTKDPFAALRAYAEEAEQEEKKGEMEMQMTQLGYEDPDVKAWRARVVKKMGGGDEFEGERGEGTGTGTGLGVGAEVVKVAKVVKDVTYGKTKGVAARTRAAGR